MRSAGYTDIERGEHGSSEEHLTVTQFKVEQEQKRLTELAELAEKKAQEAASLEQQNAKIQQQQIEVQKVEQIQAKSVSLSSKVILERSEYETLMATAKKYIVQEKKESMLQRVLDAANKLIIELKTKVASLTRELAEYKSIRARLHSANLEKENEVLRSKLRGYETIIERNNLWGYFTGNRERSVQRNRVR